MGGLLALLLRDERLGRQLSGMTEAYDKRRQRIAGLPEVFVLVLLLAAIQGYIAYYVQKNLDIRANTDSWLLLVSILVCFAHQGVCILNGVYSNGRTVTHVVYFSIIGTIFATVSAVPIVAVLFPSLVARGIDKTTAARFATICFSTAATAGLHVYVWAGLRPRKFLLSPRNRNTYAAICFFYPNLMTVIVTPVTAKIISLIDEPAWWNSPAGATAIASTIVPTACRLVGCLVCLIEEIMRPRRMRINRVKTEKEQTARAIAELHGGVSFVQAGDTVANPN